MEQYKIPTTFDVFYEPETEQINPLITKARVRIFYKYENRNRGYITDEFAAKLEQKISWTPVVGLYDLNEQDFTTHHQDRNVAPMYGLVPPNHNAAWEAHSDPDGVIRTYFTVDVYLYTGRYDVAKQIIGSPHSLEFDRDSIVGSWKRTSNGDFYFYEDADFIGLSVLGQFVEPAFEGSAFYELVEALSQEPTLQGLDAAALVSKLANFIKQADSNDRMTNKGGDESMDLKDFKFSTDDKVNSVWTAANSDFAENGTINQLVLSTTEDSVMLYSVADNSVVSKTFTSGEEGVTFSEDAINYALITSEKVAEYEKAVTDLETANVALAQAEKDLETANAKIVELEGEKSTFELEATNVKAALEQVQADFEILKGEKDAQLQAAKETLLGEYEGKVSADFAEEVKAKLADFSIEDLEKELLFAWKKEQPADFSKEAQPPMVPAAFQGEKPDGIVAVLEKYTSKNQS